MGRTGLVTVPDVIGDGRTRTEVTALVEVTFEAISTPGSAVDRIFDSPEIAVTGSGIGERYYGPEQAVSAAARQSPQAAMVELRGLEPLTPTLPVWCATSCATAPCRPRSLGCVRRV
jgi:hypothetical protein